uniref:PiggyBac transposable element-derived protein domain-containing protein n=1 Tax=Amphilophus citrinellus TaxID=61819 RepID=A0A3Q0R7S0_AMPCI
MALQKSNHCNPCRGVLLISGSYRYLRHQEVTSISRELWRFYLRLLSHSCSGFISCSLTKSDTHHTLTTGTLHTLTLQHKTSWRRHEASDPIPAPDADEVSIHSSGPDCADSGNEADFMEGIDLWHDVYVHIHEILFVFELEERLLLYSGGRERERGSRSETPSGDASAWKSEKEPDSMPKSPLHFLPKRRPGIQPPLSEYLTELTELTEAELYRYIGLTLYMGILKLPQIRDFWRASSIFHVPYPAEVMSRDRFLTITWNIHMSHPAEDALNDSKKGTDDYDCLHRIRPQYDSLRVACKAMYQPRQQISVDERMVATEARTALKQDIKNKPTKWGIKLFVLSDNTGYTGGLSFDAVMSLVNKSYLGSGYHIYCDNFYTSPALFHHFYDLGFGACGTFRDTRVGIPKTTINALTKKSPQGSVRWIREGALIFSKWMNIREVSVCSTVHTAFSGDTVTGTCNVGGKYAAVEVPVPSAVKDYNCFMGGVDLSDQLIGSYSSWRKSRKWYVAVLHHFIDIAVTNSYLLSKELCGRLEQRPMTHQAFQEQLTAELCGVPLRQVPVSYQHNTVAIVEGASGQKEATKGRRKCKLCGKKTPFMCEVCKVPLCVIVDRNCHKAYHSSTTTEMDTTKEELLFRRHSHHC